MNSLPLSYRYIPKSFSTRNFLSPSTSITSPTNNKNKNDFKKSSNLKQLNINGTSPIILFKKTPKSNHRNQIDFDLKTNEYISDGGLKKKIDKFNIEKTMKENKSTNKMLSPTQSKKMIKNQTSQSMKSIRKKNQMNKNNLKINNIENNNKKIVKRNNCFSPPPISPTSTSKNSKKSGNKSNKTKKEKEQKTEKSEKTEKTEKSELNEMERKYNYMNQLIENGVAGFLREIQLEKKPTLEDEMNEKKQKVLEENGIEINIDSLENTQDEEIKDENETNLNLENDKIEEENNNYNSNSSNNIFKGSKKVTPQINNYLITNESESFINKKVYKQKVDQFEYIRKINEEKKKFPNYITRKTTNSKSNSKNKKNENENSFRLSYSNEKNLNRRNNNNEENNFLFTFRKNFRSEEEIKNSIREKNEERKRIEEEEELKKNKKMFTIYKNLLSLFSKTQGNFKSRLNKKGTKKRNRIKNEYYVGNESNSNSTIIMPEDYYMNVLESQQLLVTGGLYKINNQNLNQSISKEKIKKITEKKNTKSLTEESNSSNLSQLKDKVSETLLKSENLINNYNLKNESKSFTTEKNLTNNNNNQLEIQINKDNNNNIKNITDDESNSNVYTKDKNLPSLSHTYLGTTIPNQKIIIEIEPRNVINLIEIIKLIFKRKTFYDLLGIYINNVMIQRYTVGFAFMTAIIKQYPFRAIEEYSNYKTYYLAFFQLFRPFLKRMFRYFINCFFTKRKIKYFTEILKRLFKFKILQKIYNYTQSIDNSDEELAFNLILTRTMKLIMKPQLKESFNIFKSNCQKYPIKKIKRDYSAKAPLELNKINEDEINISNNKIIDTNSSQSSLRYHKMKYHTLKMNSFIYESLNSSKSSYTVEPNSVDNDRLHQLQIMLINKRDDLDYENDLMYTGSDNSYEKKKMKTSSNKSAKSLQEICQMKPGLNLSRSLSELSNDNNLNNSIKKSLSNRSLQKTSSNKSLNESNEKNSKNNSISKDKDESINSLKEINNNKNNKENIDKNKFDGIPSILTKEEKIEIEKKVNNEPKKEIKEINNKQENKPKITNNEIKKKEIKEEKNKDNKEKENKNNNIIDETNIPEKNCPSISDISADKDIANQIDWEYPVSNSNSLPSENKKPIEKIDNKKGNNEKINNEINKNINSLDEEIIVEDLDIGGSSKDNSKEKKDDEKNETPTKNRINDLINKKEKNKKDIIERKNSEDEYDDFENVSDIEKDNEKEDDNIESFINNDIKQNDKSRNNLTNSPQQNEENENLDDIDIDNNNKNSKNLTDENKENNFNNEKINNINLEIENEDKFIDTITNEILMNLLSSEIKSDKVKLLPKRQYKLDPFNNLQLSLSSLSLSNKESPSKDGLTLANLPLNDNSIQALNDSLMSSYSAYSIFNKTLKTQKKENSYRLYYNKIGPQLIILIKKEIIKNYNDIYENISTPMKNQAKGLMVSLILQDADLLRENYKRLYLKKEISKIINKEKILKEFEPINKKIRESDNINFNNYEYDNMLNNCIIDSAIELINKERLYGESGDPLPWSSRTHDIYFKYDKNNPKKLCDYVCYNLLYMLHNRIGLISENYDFLSGEQLNVEREKRFIKNIHKELDECEYLWKNLEMEETQLKVEVSEMIMEQLYNEIIEILEHVQYSRKRPELYQNKSIYACEEIPKLSFQVTSTENLDSGDDDNEIMNM